MNNESSKQEILDDLHDLTKAVTALNRALLRLQMKLHDDDASSNKGEVQEDTVLH